MQNASSVKKLAVRPHSPHGERQVVDTESDVNDIWQALPPGNGLSSSS